MPKTISSKNGGFDFARALSDFRIPGFDVQAMVEAQRKNLEALTHANQLAVEGMRALAQRQAEIVQQAVEDASALFRDWAEPSAPEDRIAKSAEAARQAFEKGLANLRELNELGSKASADVLGTIAKRISESFDEVGLYAKKQAAAE
jgi:phasin family protein